MIKNNTYMGHALRIVVEITVLVLLFATSIFTAQGAIYPEAKIISLSENSNVNVTVEASSSGYNNLFGLYDPIYRELFWGHQTSPGTKFNLGSFPAYTELVFFVKSPDGLFKNGPASRNPDNTVHGAITDVGPQIWKIGFEDLWGGGDRDYNDIQALVTGDLYVIPPNPTKPDLIIMPGDISFSNPNPSSSKIIEIQANIHNFGSATDKTIAIGFYDGGPEHGGELIFNAPIYGIGKEVVKTLNVAFETAGKIGSHNIYVKADSLEQIDEIFETNNKAYQELVIGNPPALSPGIITAVSTAPINPMYRQTYNVLLSLNNPNSVAQYYQVGLKNDGDDVKGYNTYCQALDQDLGSRMVNAHETSVFSYRCITDWDWIPADKGGYEELMKTYSKGLSADIAQDIAKNSKKIGEENPFVNPILFWADFADILNVAGKVKKDYPFNSWGQGVEKSPSVREGMNRTPCN